MAKVHDLKKVDYHPRRKQYVAVCTCWLKEYFSKADYPHVDLTTAAYCELADHINEETEKMMSGG